MHNFLIAAKLRGKFILAGEDLPDEAIKIFIGSILLPALVKRSKYFKEEDKIIVSLS